MEPRSTPHAGSPEPASAREATASQSASGGPLDKPETEKSTTRRPLWVWIACSVLVVFALYEAVPWAVSAFRTVSTDDAYVNGHVTFVAPRVDGQVTRVLVDDNNRVHKGNVLVNLDQEPYRVKVDIAQAQLAVAQADLVAAQANVRGLAGLARSQRFALAQSIEDLHNLVAELHAKVAALQAMNATLTKASHDYDREVVLFQHRVIAAQMFDTYQEAFSVAKAQRDNAQEDVYRIRAELGLPRIPSDGARLDDVPKDLDQHFSAVKEAQYRLAETVSQLGVVRPFRETPDQMLAGFYKLDPSGNIDIIINEVLKAAPEVKQAEAKVSQAQANLHQAKLNLSYCDVVADIDGVVTMRDVNPGDHVVAGQELMALRSLTDIWVDANFKETQLAELRIGQPVDLVVDMYGRSRRFRGRISGFTMGTGSTLALLPPENATGNYVKVVQRLPVRIDLIGYNPDTIPLFIGLSVTPYVEVYEKPTGPNAGQFLQDSLAARLPLLPPNPR